MRSAIGRDLNHCRDDPKHRVLYRELPDVERELSGDGYAHLPGPTIEPALIKMSSTTPNAGNQTMV